MPRYNFPVLLLLLLPALLLPACNRSTRAKTTIYLTARDIKAGEKLAAADLLEVGLSQPPGGPDVSAGVIQSANLKGFLGRPFARDVKKEELLVPDMFDLAATAPATLPGLRIEANPERLNALGISLTDFSHALQQLMARNEPLTPDSPLTINGTTYHLRDLANVTNP